MEINNIQSVNDLLQRYLDEIKDDAAEPTETVASEAKALGISAGTLSQLRSGKPITAKVISKIADKISSGDKSRRKQIEEELEKARRLEANVDLTHAALDDVSEFLKPSGLKRLICVVYRDIPQSRDQGTYPGYIDQSARFINREVSLAMFQIFGPLEQIKQNAKAAYDKDDVVAPENWNYVYKLASGVWEVFRKTKKAIESNDNPGEVVLYETVKTPPLNICDINSRLFYSHEVSRLDRKIRVAHLIRAVDKEKFIESENDSAYQLAVSAQFQPILQFWLAKGRLPIKNAELKSYQHNNDYSWNVIEDP